MRRPVMFPVRTAFGQPLCDFALIGDRNRLAVCRYRLRDVSDPQFAGRFLWQRTGPFLLGATLIRV
jgi:hypothetical protein